MIDQLSFDDLKNKFNQNKNFKIGTYVVGGLLVAIILYFSYRQFIWGPANEKSNDGWWVALNYISKDSTDQAIRVLEPFVKNNDGKTGGEIGQYLLGKQYMKKGNYVAALKMLEDVNLNDTYVSTMSLGLQADCHSQMKHYDQALELYVSAANKEENDIWSKYTISVNYHHIVDTILHYIKHPKSMETFVNDMYPRFKQMRTSIS